MNDPRREQESPDSPAPSRLHLVLRDVQFWVPVAVLIGGLLVLTWIH